MGTPCQSGDLQSPLVGVILVSNTHKIGLQHSLQSFPPLLYHNIHYSLGFRYSEKSGPPDSNRGEKLRW